LAERLAGEAADDRQLQARRDGGGNLLLTWFVLTSLILSVLLVKNQEPWEQLKATAGKLRNALRRDRDDAEGA
jgi:hypothetical protein